ncbi:flavodoxin domain-containing protein [Paraglaciecola arctica]|uniref:flavodoxin domain-containing protein n=1 Tax=Paraglaciecola arctica TaxID=1128911 RepID=UPI001C06C6F6|nr:flavodoxin domain-containing protein [Paraglaciecola arctica]MBU3003613.1 flavodoxin domain-containing protein [Paraglaciecola arctica]
MSKIGIFVGSVYGNAQHVAEEVHAVLSKHGLLSEVFVDPTLDDFKNASSMLFISSTTGQGDIPPNLEFFIQDLRDQFPLLEQKPFAVVGLGDSSYGETYCGAGRQIFELLIELQGKPITALLEIDACETLEPEAEVVAWLENVLSDFA